MSMQEATAGIPQWELHHRLERALEHAEVKVGDMGSYIGVSRQTMTNYLSGRTRPRDGMLRLWALRCGVPFEWLVDGDERSPEPDGPGLPLSTPPGTRTQNLRDNRPLLVLAAA